MSELRELAEYAADARWDELASGAEFTLIDRHMLRELHTRARVALAVLDSSSRSQPVSGSVPLSAREAEPAAAWRPIETAPRDGTPILIYFKRLTGRLEGAWRVEWFNVHGETTPDEGSWCVDDEKHGPYPLRGYCEGDATHWMPLPPLPNTPLSAGKDG